MKNIFLTLTNLKPVLGLLIILTIYSRPTNETRINDKFQGIWRLDKFEACGEVISRGPFGNRSNMAIFKTPKAVEHL